MISGRGLGHTGGTLDKLESIPGYRIHLTLDEIRKQLHDVHAFIAGQTSTLAPADKRMYAIRDVTGSVSSIPLITASILSKKLAEGLTSLVLDVKVGSGAFMTTRDDALALAESLSRVGRAAGVKVNAILTAMEEPLGLAVGNANEMAESIRCLRGEGPDDLRRLVVELGATLLVSTGQAPELAAGRNLVEEAISSGRALAAFRELVKAQGGDAHFIDDLSLLPTGKLRSTVNAPQDGYVQQLDARRIGRALIALGGGRRIQEDAVDPGVGIELLVKVGAKVEKGQVIAEVNANSPQKMSEALTMVQSAIRVGSTPAKKQELILDRR
jgi:pyrimidine-nucleoside phosphorylase